MGWPGFDYHTHICGTDIDLMIAAALARGVREYGVSEHIFQLDEGHVVFPELEEEGVRFPRSWYIETVQDRARNSDVEIMLGLEVDFVPGTEDAVADILADWPWDYLIGSVHEIAGHDLFKFPPDDVAHGKQLWTDYYALFIAAIESGRFDVLSHPLRNALLNPHIPESFDDMLFEVASAAVRNGVALELNGEDVTTWPALVERLAVACAKSGCAVSFGSDAHGPADVARGMHLAAEIAQRAGVPGAMSFRARDRRIVPFT